MNTNLTLDTRTLGKVEDDLCEAAGPSGIFRGTLVLTSYGMVLIGDDEHAPMPPMLATDEHCDEWNYAWVLLDDILAADYGFSKEDVLVAAARSDERRSLEVDFAEFWDERNAG